MYVKLIFARRDNSISNVPRLWQIKAVQVDRFGKKNYHTITWKDFGKNRHTSGR